MRNFCKPPFSDLPVELDRSAPCRSAKGGKATFFGYRKGEKGQRWLVVHDQGDGGMRRRAMATGFLAIAAWHPVGAQTPMTATRAELEALLSEVFAELDANADGVHTFAEREAAIESEPAFGDPKTRLEIAAAEFKREDVDRNGKVTLAEFGSQPIASFDCIDSDKDGVASEAERAAASPACEISDEA